MPLYNLKSPAVKRLMRETEELCTMTEEYHAQPLEDNLFEWHFTIRGPPNTDFDGGIYHGRITLPPDYPMKPPSIILLTPNGRFETNKKICLSISGHHPESWQPSWSIRTAILAIIGFLPTHGNGAIGSLDYTPEERSLLASKSQMWQCKECGPIKNILKNSNGYVAKESDINNVVQENHVTSKSQIVETNTTAAFQCKESHISDKPHTFINNPEDLPGIMQDKNSSDLFELTEDSDLDTRDYLEEESSNVRERNVGHCEPKSNKSEQSDTVNQQERVTNHASLVCIWVIVFVLGILIARRLFYQ